MEAKQDSDVPEADYPSYAEYQNRRPAILKKVAWGVGLAVVLGGALGACRQAPPTDPNDSKSNLCVPKEDLKLRGEVAAPSAFMTQERTPKITSGKVRAPSPPEKETSPEEVLPKRVEK
ncbi:MAG: hypothetical protein HQK55_16790 [Deltaproteobacteria bacterium]|nr:hypothetical protein [Deltaproteobacteria bacterium]